MGDLEVSWRCDPVRVPGLAVDDWVLMTPDGCGRYRFPFYLLAFSEKTVAPGRAEGFLPRYFVVSNTIAPLEVVEEAGTAIRGSE
jgi:hypothetical protein